MDNQCRRFSVHYSNTVDAFLKSNSSRNCGLLSLFLLMNGPETLPNVLTTKFLKAVCLLKVLDLQDAPLDYLLGEIGNLYCLKYLSLRNTKVDAMPRSIGQIQELPIMYLKQSLVHDYQGGLRGFKT